MRYLSIAVLVSFIALAAFGFIGMVHGAGCLAQAVNGMECPESSLAAAVYHTNAFLALHLAILAVFLFAVVFASAPLAAPVLLSMFSGELAPCRAVPSALRNLLCWLELHKASPPRRFVSD